MFRSSRHRTGLLWLAAAALTWMWAERAAAQQTIIHLRNGDRITGVIISEGTNSMVLSNALSPSIVIPQQSVARREAVTAPPLVNTGMAVAVAPATPTPPPVKTNVTRKPLVVWGGEIQLGADLGFSERNRQLYTGRAKVNLTYDGLRNLFDYSFSYGRTDGIISANRMDGSIKSDYDLTRRLYIYNLAGGGYDEIRRIDRRYETGPGLGVHLVRRTNVVLKTEFGVNYQAQYLADDTETEKFFFRLAEEAGWKITPKLSFDEKFEFFPQVENFGIYRFRFESNIRYSLLNNLFFTVTVIDQYDSAPAEGIGPNDLQVRSTIGVKF
jgi:putative salt-induced outer membrane protein YdiY